MYIGLKNIVSSQNRINKKKEVKKEEIVIVTHTSHTKNRHIIGSYATLGI